MAFGTQDDVDEVMNEINMTPLVDVMLVLLIIFIITVPVIQHSVNLNLPQASSAIQDLRPETIRLSVDAGGQYFWNENPIGDADLAPRLAAEAAKDPQPDLHIRGDKDVRYERVAQLMAAAQQAGLGKIGFITVPENAMNPPRNTPPAPAQAPATARPPLLESTQLLQGHRAVEIHHNGELYRLQATRTGKLILTK